MAIIQNGEKVTGDITFLKKIIKFQEECVCVILDTNKHWPAIIIDGGCLAGSNIYTRR